MFDIHGVFLYSNHMQTRLRQIQLKLRKANELIIKLKVKYLDQSSVYSDINKIDEKLIEIDKLIDNNK
jgi:hypothetical protein